ncbi:MAG: PDZ domain-containing protein [Bacilli bacterium]|nr:PDZ domain-containing protein [Bacilli bacterium]
MSNNKYEKILQFIKTNLLVPILIFVILYIVMNINLPWSVYSPGGLISVKDRLNVDDASDNYYLTYVSFSRGTPATLLFACLMPEWDIVSNDEIKNEQEDMDDVEARDKIYMEEAISNSTFLAYTKAGITPNITNNHIYVTYILEQAQTDLKVGDEIIGYDNIKYTDYDSFGEYIHNKKAGETIKLQVKRQKKNIDVSSILIDIDGESKMGVALSVINEYKNTPNVKYTAKNSESGSSGGLMMTLTLYDYLTKEDIHKNRKIAGTGTISIDGTVGEIAGVKYKLAGAVKKKADIFLVPSENYEEALELQKKYDYKIKIIEAKTFDQVLEELKK